MTLLDTQIHRLDGSPSTLGELAGGNAVLLVNVASECGYTGQYAGLETLHEKYADRGLSVIGVPCNQFGEQEPGTAEEIQSFCTRNFGVTFPLTEKVDVNGPDRHPLYVPLVDTPNDKGYAGDVRWNFEKFLLTPDGEVVARFRHKVEPDDPALVSAIEGLLES